MHAINEGVYDWDIAGGTIYYSDRVRTVMGFSPKELRSPAAFLDRVHPNDLPRTSAPRSLRTSRAKRSASSAITATARVTVRGVGGASTASRCATHAGAPTA